MLLELSVKLAQGLRLDDITDIDPDPGVIGSDNVAKITGLIALFWWVVSAGLVLWLGVAIYLYSQARRNNPAEVQAAKSKLTATIVALVLYGGISTIVQITTGFLSS